MVQFITILSSALLAGMAMAQEPNAMFNASVVSQVAGEIDSGTSCKFYPPLYSFLGHSLTLFLQLLGAILNTVPATYFAERLQGTCVTP